VSVEKPWRGAVWSPIPGCTPTDVRRGKFKTASDAQAWVKRLRMRSLTGGRRIVIWHVTQLPPAELEQPAERPKLHVVREAS
jgi:hypothetical protein